MPLTPVGITGVLIPNLVSTGMLGTGVPQFASGVAAGVMLWLGALTVTTVDVGTYGAGAGLAPCVIPSPLLLTGMLTSFPATGHVGAMTTLFATGIANGLTSAFLQGLITTVHPTVGVGTAVCTFPGPSAIPPMIAGFKSVGMVGPMTEATATAVGMGIDLGFGAFIIPIPIVGPASTLGSSGTGTGKLV